MLSPTLKKRIFIVRALFVIFFLMLATRLIFIQIVYYKFYQQYGDQQYKVTIKETPPRALIYDRAGRILALNQPRLALFITPKSLKDPQAVITFIKKNFPE